MINLILSSKVFYLVNINPGNHCLFKLNIKDPRTTFKDFAVLYALLTLNRYLSINLFFFAEAEFVFPLFESFHEATISNN